MPALLPPVKQVFKAMQEAGVTVSGIQATAVYGGQNHHHRESGGNSRGEPAKKTAKAATTKAAAKKTTAKKAAPTKAAPKKATEEPEAEQDEELEAEDVDLEEDLEEDPAAEADDADGEEEDGEEAEPKKTGQATEEEDETRGFVFSDSDEEDQPAQQVVTAGATADPVKDYLKQIGKVAPQRRARSRARQADRSGPLR